MLENVSASTCPLLLRCSNLILNRTWNCFTINAQVFWALFPIHMQLIFLFSHCCPLDSLSLLLLYTHFLIPSFLQPSLFVFFLIFIFAHTTFFLPATFVPLYLSGCSSVSFPSLLLIVQKSQTLTHLTKQRRHFTFDVHSVSISEGAQCPFARIETESTCHF